MFAQLTKKRYLLLRSCGGKSRVVPHASGVMDGFLISKSLIGRLNFQMNSHQSRPSALQHILLLCLFILMLLHALGSPLSAQDSRENADFKLAVGLYNDAMYDLAVEQLKNFVAAYPSTSQGVEARYYLGMAQMTLKRYEEARVTFQNFALTYTDHPRAPEAWLNVGEAYAAEGNEREAASAYERVKVFHPKSPLVPDALLKAAGLYRRLGDRESARKAFRTIIQDYPASKSVFAARLGIGAIYAEEGRMDVAEREALRVSQSNAPPVVRAEALLMLGKLQTDECLFDDADSNFKSIITTYKTTPSAPAAALEHGILEMRAEKYSAALGYLKGVADSDTLEDSLQASALFAIGKLHNFHEKFTDAELAFEKLITKFPHSTMAAEAALEAGRSAYRGKAFDQALHHARNIIALPASEFKRQAYILAAQASMEGNKYPDAVGYYNWFLLSYPNDPFEPDVMMQLGDFYREKIHQYRNAVTVYDQLIQRYPLYFDAARATYDISVCQEKLNDFDGAVQTCKELMERYPAYLAADELGDRIESLASKTVAARDQIQKELAALVGQLLAQSSKADCAFRLGELYFNTMHDYASAAGQFGDAIDAGVSKELFAEAYYYRARAYQLSSVDDSIREKTILYYDSFLKLYPNSRRSDDAAYYSFLLKSQRHTGMDVAAAAKAFLTNHPTTSHQDEIFSMLGLQGFTDGKFREAIDYFSLIIRGNSGFALTLPPNRFSILTSAFRQRGKAYIALDQIDSADRNFGQADHLSRYDRHIGETAVDLAGAYLERGIYPSLIAGPISNKYSYTAAAQGIEQRLANGLIASKEYDRAISLYEELARRDRLSPFTKDGDPDNVYYLASAYDGKDQRDRAKGLYRQYLKDNIKPEFAPQAFSALGVIARQEGNNRHASYYFRKAARMKNEGGTANILLAEQLYQTQQYPEAAALYVQMARSRTRDSSGREYLARAIVSYLKADNLTEARKLIAEYTGTYGKDRPAQAEHEFETGSLYYRKQDYVSAKRSFENVTDDYGDTRFAPWGHFYLGKILEVSGKLQDAARKYDDILTKYPKSDVLPRVLLSLGNMHFNAERFEESIKYYQRIVDIKDSTNDVISYAMNNLIEAYESTKLYDAAIKTLREFITRYPNSEGIIDKKIKLGTLYTKAGYYDQSIMNFQNLIDEGGSQLEAELRYDIGEAYYYKGDYQQAILEFLKVPYLVTRQGKIDWVATSLYMAGQSYEKISKFDEAMNMYQQIIDRPGIESTYKAGARKEIDRVKQLVKKGPN